MNPGMELDENKFRGLSCGEIKQQVFSLGRSHRMRNTPPRVDSSATPADSESSPPTSPVSSRGKRFAIFDSPNTPRSLVRRLREGFTRFFFKETLEYERVDHGRVRVVNT